MSFYELWISFSTIVIKEVRRFLRIWVQTLIPPIITMALYFVIFGNLIGRRVGEMGGFDYVAYIVPGLIMMSVITNSYSNVVSSFYSAKFQNQIEEVLVSPTPNFLILVGYIVGGVARGLIVGFIVTLVSLFFTDLHIAHVGIMLSVVVLTSILFALAGFLNAIYAKNFDDISIIPNFVLTPLTYLGGVFYSIDLLPEFWRNLSLINPILYMVNAFRFGVLGVSDIDVVTAFGVIMLFILAFFVLGLYLLKHSKGLRS
ncbi:MAG: ABC transporter permease [Pseudomonadales bacterium]|nr:ABC transporter permease [Pseudomonadales bacterium]MCP5214467.1 ABC transporter permease [Pseudomonadales bacterium]